MINVDLLIEYGAHYKTFEPHEHIFREGGDGIYYHQLHTGRVAWGNSNDEGKEFIQRMVEPGECFGELPLFDDEIYAAEAVAIETSVVIRLLKEDFIKILKKYPDIHFEFSKILAQIVRYDFMLLKTFAFENPENRIESLLKYLNKTNTCTGENIPVNLTRQQIANMTGLRVETVIRTIRNMYSKGKLEISNGKVYI